VKTSIFSEPQGSRAQRATIQKHHLGQRTKRVKGAKNPGSRDSKGVGKGGGTSSFEEQGKNEDQKVVKKNCQLKREKRPVRQLGRL